MRQLVSAEPSDSIKMANGDSKLQDEPSDSIEMTNGDSKLQDSSIVSETPDAQAMDNAVGGTDQEGMYVHYASKTAIHLHRPGPC